MRTPLLQSDEDMSPPWLSSGPVVVEESEFSRLISQSSNLNNNNNTAPFLDPFAVTTANDATAALQHLQQSVSVTVAAGTLCIMHAAFVWGSFLSDVWTETHLVMAVGWQQTYLPMLDDLTDTTIRSTNLASLLQDLAVTQQYVLLALLWVSSLLLPCCFMILSPTWIVSDYNQNHASMPIIQRMRTWQARGTVETIVRWALLILFVLMLLDLTTAVVELHWTDTVLQVRNRAVGGLSAYVSGIASALAAILVLRSPRKAVKNGSKSTARAAAVAAIRSPSPTAFQHPWRLVEEPSMTVLEEGPTVPAAGPKRHYASEVSTPELIQETASVVAAVIHHEPVKLTFRHRVLVFQFCLLAAVFWIPSLYLPLFRVSYGGVAGDLMTAQSRSLFLWQIPALLWAQGIQAATARWMLLGIGFVSMNVVLVLPVVAFCLGITTWLGEADMSRRSQHWLYCIHPALGGLVFALALIATVPSLEPLGNLWLDSSTVCDQFRQATGEPCLTITGKLLPGAWFFLAQSIVLDIFAVLTLQWA